MYRKNCVPGSDACGVQFRHQIELQGLSKYRPGHQNNVNELNTAKERKIMSWEQLQVRKSAAAGGTSQASLGECTEVSTYHIPYDSGA
jgi:hypothetical protein